MISIGMIGEYPTDIDCIIALLKQKFKRGFKFYPLLYGMNGSLLEEQSIKRRLRVAYEIEQPDIIIFIRDLDSNKKDKLQLQKRKQYFTKHNRVVDKKGVYLLNIQELEAILLSDVSILNTHYKVTLEAVEDCQEIPHPKDYIKSKILNYTTGNNLALFQLYKYQNVVNKCTFFKKFDTEFSAKLN